MTYNDWQRDIAGKVGKGWLKRGQTQSYNLSMTLSSGMCLVGAEWTARFESLCRCQATLNLFCLLWIKMPFAVCSVDGFSGRLSCVVQGCEERKLRMKLHSFIIHASIHTLTLCPHIWYALIFSICFLQILHSVKECAARLRPFSIYDSTGKICRYALNMCQCVYVSEPGQMCSSVCFLFFRGTSASAISMFSHHWYQLWAAWLEMMSSVTLLLTIQNVGRPSCLPLLVSLSDRSLCI